MRRFLPVLCLLLAVLPLQAVKYDKPQSKTPEKKPSQIIRFGYSLMEMMDVMSNALLNPAPTRPQQMNFPVYRGGQFLPRENVQEWDGPEKYRFQSVHDGMGASGRFTRGTIHVTVASEYSRPAAYRPSGKGINILGNSGMHNYQVVVVGGGFQPSAAAANFSGGSTTTRTNNLNSGAIASVSLPALAMQRKNAEALEAAAETTVGLRRAPGTPDHGGDNQQPLGDALLPLLLLACAYAVYKRKSTFFVRTA